MNCTLISIGLDSKLIFWDILSGKVLQSKELDYTADHLEINRDNGLIAISKSNFEIEVTLCLFLRFMINLLIKKLENLKDTRIKSTIYAFLKIVHGFYLFPLIRL